MKNIKKIDIKYLNKIFDFISLNYGNFYWPAFNLADIYITVGIIMLITTIFINFDQKK